MALQFKCNILGINKYIFIKYTTAYSLQKRTSNDCMEQCTLIKLSASFEKMQSKVRQLARVLLNGYKPGYMSSAFPNRHAQ